MQHFCQVCYYDYKNKKISFFAMCRLRKLHRVKLIKILIENVSIRYATTLKSDCPLPHCLLLPAS